LNINKKIAKKVGLNKSTISRHINDLIKNKLIKKSTKSNIHILELTWQGQHLLHQFADGGEKCNFKIKVNQHSLVVTMELLNNPQLHDWGVVNHSTWQGKKKQMKGYTVEVTPSTVQLYLDTIYAINPIHARTATLDIIARAKKELLEKYNIKTAPKFNVRKQHIALLNTPLGLLAADKNIYYVSDRMHLDRSNGEIHEEYVNPKYALEDAEFAIKCQEQIIRHRIEPLHEREKLTFVVNMLYNYSKQMEMHLNAVKNLSIAAKENKEATKELMEQIKVLTEKINEPKLLERVYRKLKNIASFIFNKANILNR